MTTLIIGIDVGAESLVAAAGVRGKKAARLGSFANAPEHNAINAKFYCPTNFILASGEKQCATKSIVSFWH